MKDFEDPEDPALQNIPFAFMGSIFALDMCPDLDPKAPHEDYRNEEHFQKNLLN